MNITCHYCHSIIDINENFFSIYNTICCPQCNAELDVTNILVDVEILIRNLQKMFSTLGIEATIEFITKNNNLPYTKFYLQLLKEKHLIK